MFSIIPLFVQVIYQSVLVVVPPAAATAVVAERDAAVAPA